MLFFTLGETAGGGKPFISLFFSCLKKNAEITSNFKANWKGEHPFLTCSDIVILLQPALSEATNGSCKVLMTPCRVGWWISNFRWNVGFLDLLVGNSSGLLLLVERLLCLLSQGLVVLFNRFEHFFQTSSF